MTWWIWLTKRGTTSWLGSQVTQITQITQVTQVSQVASIAKGV